jgi:hypothetical protein
MGSAAGLWRHRRGGRPRNDREPKPLTIGRPAASLGRQEPLAKSGRTAGMVGEPL